MQSFRASKRRRAAWAAASLATLAFLPVSQAGVPLPLRGARQSVREAPADRAEPGLWVAPRVDVARLIVEDEQRKGHRGVPPRLGFSMKAGLSPADSGVWNELADGDRLWRLTVRSENALWLVLGFGTYRLQPGGRLEIRDPGGRTRFGPYTSDDVRDHGQLWLPPIPGDTAIIELHWPRELADVEPNIHLGKISHGYRPWAAPPGGVSDDQTPGDGGFGAAAAGFCNVDINCPLGAPWQTQKLGVVQLLIEGQVACTGSLINNTNLDCRPYILSAWHCFHIRIPGMDPIDYDPAATTFRFNFEQPQCGGNSNNLPQQMVTGASVVSQWTGSDFILLELNDAPPSNFAHYFNGWNRAATAPTESTTIHHPTADTRKISINTDPLVNGQFFGPFHWRVGQWEVGTTESGSSGAPLFDQEQRVVGQLHGGTADCDEFLWDEFGKLDASWVGAPGSVVTARLNTWLDPGGTGVVTLDGLDPLFCESPQPRLVRRALLTDDTVGNRDGIPDPGEAFTLEIELHNDGTLPATNVTGTLTTTDTGVTITGDQAIWPDLAQIATSMPIQPFTLQLADDFPCGDQVHVNAAVTAQEGSWGYPIVLDTGVVQVAPLFDDDIESGTNGWTVQSATGTGLNPNPWTQSQCAFNPPLESCTDPGERFSSPTRSWYVPNIGMRSDARLIMPAAGPLPEETVLRFSHYMNSERTFDGGVLEYSTNNGTTWIDARLLITSGGYNATIVSITGSALGGRQAWSGDLGSFQDVEVDLSSLAGQTVLLRWRFATDLSNPDEGWYVDDVRLDDINHACGLSRPRVFPGERCGGSLPTPSGARPAVCGPSRPRP